MVKRGGEKIVRKSEVIERGLRTKRKLKMVEMFMKIVDCCKIKVYRRTKKMMGEKKLMKNQ